MKVCVEWNKLYKSLEGKRIPLYLSLPFIRVLREEGATLKFRMELISINLILTYFNYKGIKWCQLTVAAKCNVLFSGSD